MGARLGFGLKRAGPAPNAYALRLGPGTPAYTMGARVGYSLKSKSPGPAVYFQREADVYKTRLITKCFDLNLRKSKSCLSVRKGGGGRQRVPIP